MRALFLAAALLSALLAFSPASAHRVNVFAWIDGGDVAVECGFSRGSPVNGGEIVVLDAENGGELLRGRTDAQGRFRFPVPETARAGRGLRIVIRAGEGHQNEWLMDASELAGAPMPVSAPAAGNAPPAASAAASTEDAPAPMADTARAATPEDVRRIVEQALDAGLAPLRRELAARNAGGPGLQDVVGGIGWILGLVGLALCFWRRGGARRNG